MARLPPGSYNRQSQLKALHTVSAWSSEHRLVLAQQKVEGKSNEITAVPLLLKLLNLKGAVVTLDAMGIETEIARQIKQMRRGLCVGRQRQPGKALQASPGLVFASKCP